MFTYRPPAYHPRMAQVVAPAVTTVAPINGVTAGMPIPEGILWTAVSAAAAWAAIRTGMREKGLPSVAGWAGGVAAGLAALLGLTGVLAPSAARTFPFRWYWVA